MSDLSDMTKDPDAVLDYHLDWARWLKDVDVIDSVVWTVGNLTIEAQSETDTVATVWLSGGVAGTQVEVTCRVTTTGGRVDDRSSTFYVRER